MIGDELHMRCSRQVFAARPAMTLVEVLVVVALSSMVVGVAISLMVGLQQRDRGLRDHGVRNEQLLRLAETMRADIRRATEVSQPVPEQLLIASNTDDQIRYELVPEGCRRTVEAVGEERPRIELFTIGPAASWTIERREEGRRLLIAATIARPATENNHVSRPPPLVVHAALGADLPQ